MSGRNKAQVTLRLTQALRIVSQFAGQSWEKAWQRNEEVCDTIGTYRSNAEKLLNSGEKTGGADQAIQEGDRHQKEAFRLRKEAEKRHLTAEKKRNEAQKNAQKISDSMQKNSDQDYISYSVYNEAAQCESMAKEAERMEKEAIQLLNQSAEQVKHAQTAFERIRILIEQKKEEERQREIKRLAAVNDVRAVKNEIDHLGLGDIEQWCGNPVLLDKAKSMFRSAEETLVSDRFEDSRSFAAKSLELFRQLHEMAIENKKRVESRNVITKAIVEALNELQYDKPDVRYLPQPGSVSEKNHRLSDLTIFAKAPGKMGDVRVRIDLDGKTELDINDIPEGKEDICDELVRDLQSKTEGIVNIEITEKERTATGKQGLSPGAGVVEAEPEPERE